VIKIYVSPYRCKNGLWSTRRILWAAFRSSRDAERFLDQLHAENPSWVIRTVRGGGGGGGGTR
jgi:hypothetical protein